MARRLNWEKVARERLPKMSVTQEGEFISRDLATKWLGRADRLAEERKARTRKAERSKAERAAEQVRKRNRKQSGPPPW